MDIRFKFGKNWSNFLAHLNSARIEQAKQSLQKMLALQDLKGKTFIDVGSGSGLFSLAARMLGAKVYSFDFDPLSVNCTNQLRERFFPDDTDWKVESGSVLDRVYLSKLGQFDIVYSWGVLHHTGAMWEALENVTTLIKPDGLLFIAIYNDQGFISKIWHRIKKTYVSVPVPFQLLMLVAIGITAELAKCLLRLLTLQNPLPFKDWATRSSERGMSLWHDLVDWVGGYPFEYAKPEKIFYFFKEHGFYLEALTTKRAGQGCCEYVFRKK